MSLKRGIGPRSTSLLMSLGLCLRASDCENAWQVGLARRAENAGCLFSPPLLNRSAIGWPNMCWCQEYKSAHRTKLRVPTTTSHLGLVSRVSPVQTAMRNCTRDEGRSFGFGNQVLISSHRKLLWSKAMVVSVAEKSGHDPVRHG